jgi:BirA family transcriptional regulator, biotin operon repressor / biotin---[acetyl-CoA-carboxylase] ligase
MNTQEIAPFIDTEFLGKDIRCFETLDSTNIRAKTLLKEDARHGTVVIAEEQTAGRGRVGRAWNSEKGKNLTFSAIIQPTMPSNKYGILSLLAGVAIAEAVQKVTQLAPQCKWPNDVYIGSKKVCGILCEAVFTGGKPPAVVIGIGINVNQNEFSPELQKIATSIFIETGKQFNRFEILGSILQSMEHWLNILEAGDTATIISTWRTFSYLKGREITIDHFGRLTKGIAGDICDDGGMMVHADGQDIKVMAGDINVYQ